MGYNKKELEEQALRAINDYKLTQIEDIVCYVACSKKTFYTKRLHELPSIKEAIQEAKTHLRVSLRKKMHDSNHPTDRVFLYKLVATDDELERVRMDRRGDSGGSGGEQAEQPLFPDVTRVHPANRDKSK